MYEGTIGPSPKIYPPTYFINVVSKDGVELNDGEIEAIHENGPVRIMYDSEEELEKLGSDRPFDFGERISFDIGPNGKAINVKRID